MLKASEGILYDGLILRPVPKGYIPAYHKDGKEYVFDEHIYYYSTRYNRGVLIEWKSRSNGADYAFDIISLGWGVHDVLCKSGEWYDGTPVTNWQASRVLSDILYYEKRNIRSKAWFWMTFVLGCHRARLNGMFRRKQ